ncbi:MAG: ABC transporter ATP-binding protein [Bacillota bacterium]
MAAIVVENLTKLYGGRLGCRNINMTVPRGHIFGFLGPNGAGKTTLVKTLVGLLHPTSGRAWLLGRPLGDVAIRRRIGYLPENFRYHDWLTGAELLAVHGALCGLPARETRRRIPEVLDLVGLTGRERQKIRNYSKGMQQRLGVACALIGDPDLVFLDEPTSALDPLGRREMRELMLALRARGKTVFLNSHLLSEVEMVCDTVAIINRGEIVTQGALRDLLAPALEVEMEIEGSTPALEAALAAAGREVKRNGGVLRLTVGDRAEIPGLARLVVEHGAALYRLVSVQRSLEDLFVDVVQGGN